MSKSQKPPPGLSIVKPHWRPAIITKDFGGQFSRWKVGEAVLVGPYEDDFDGHPIERAVWKDALVPLCNTCYGVPRDVLDLKPNSEHVGHAVAGVRHARALSKLYHL